MENNRTFLIKAENDTYKLDLDQNGFPTFTQKNIDFITAMISYDSTYSKASEEGGYETIFQEPDFWGFSKLNAAIISLDKINSTRLASEGRKSGGGRGREKTADYICNNIGSEKLRQRLIDKDSSLVNQIAAAVKTKYNFSFASKFCAYVSRFALKMDNYCIYDNVVQAILPYYYYIYVDGDGYRNLYNTNRSGNNQSIVEQKYREKSNTNGYDAYRQCVDDIIAGIRQKCGITVTYSQFDHILWYCFKGSESKIQNALNCLPQKSKKI